MFERFTENTRDVVVRAHREAGRLGHLAVSTEHLLLALVRDQGCAAGQVLEALGIPPKDVRTLTEQVVGKGQRPPVRHLPFTMRAKAVLESSAHEAARLGCGHVGTEHILLALLDNRDGVAAQILTHHGATLERAREQAARVMADSASNEACGTAPNHPAGAEASAVAAAIAAQPPCAPAAHRPAGPARRARGTRWSEPDIIASDDGPGRRPTAGTGDRGGRAARLWPPRRRPGA